MKYLELAGGILYSPVFPNIVMFRFKSGAVGYTPSYASVLVPFSGLIAIAGVLSKLIGIAWLIVIFHPVQMAGFMKNISMPDAAQY